MQKKSELTLLIEKFKNDQTNKCLAERIGNILRKYSLEDKWLPTIVGQNNEILTHEVGGEKFIPIFSDDKYIVAKGNDVLVTSINKIMVGLIENTEYAGFEINPFSMGLCIRTGDLLRAVFGNRECYDEEKKDWGLGIPKYSDSDILDKKSILDFSIQAVGTYLEKDNCHGLFCTNDLDANPNIIIRKNGKLAFVLSEGDIYPNMPSLTFEKRKELLRRSKHFGFDCYYAPISFMPSDLMRANKSLALRGDSYYVKYEGLQKVDELYN